MINVTPGQIITAEQYRSVKDDAYQHYNRITSAPYNSTKPRSSNIAYRPYRNYNFAALKVKVGDVITAYKYNELSTTLDGMISRDCACDCNYCTCNCNYCSCNCDYCTCDCNYSCSCNCNYCTCNCNYACTCRCNY